MIYGSSRLGTWKSCVELLSYIPAEPEILVTDRGCKQYEMNDHLGNVHAVVSDRKKRICDEGEFAYYEADIRSTYDYYAFGMMMPGRDHSAPVCSLVPDTGYVQLVYDTFTTSAPGWLYLSDFSSPNLSGGEMVFDRGMSDILFKSISGSAHGKKYRVSFDVELNGCDSIGFAGDLDSAQVTTFTVSGSHNFEFTSTGFYTGIFIILSDSCGASFDNVLVEEMVFGTTTLCKPQDSYRFGFNGQMKDNEVYGEGNSYTAEYWQYDPRLGRRWNVDPVDQVSISNYACFRNNPIYFVDIKGDFNSKSGARLYKFFHGKKGDQIYKKDGTDIWVVGRQTSHQEKFINEMTGEQTILTTISVQEITKWNNEKAENTLRGGLSIYNSDGPARTTGTGDYGDPSGMMDFSELQGLFGAWGPDESALKYAAKWIGKLSKSPDTQDLITLLKIFDTVKGKADRGEAIAEAIAGIKEDYDLAKRMEKYNEPDSVFIVQGQDTTKVPANKYTNQQDGEIYDGIGGNKIEKDEK